eukprot:CAMPEP_0180183342 /NCGR_PEP_ID=MMETSP0986-20121125/41178_1 /TAXON_ID=697907 /ORGANISM="non described non described, Strain CCMP2293" /LENGTH=75 /DNA_ID=CAMNT_0022136831 /DNA_START=17 /DNA_END=244 /DNA_ORIENTATION=+
MTPDPSHGGYIYASAGPTERAHSLHVRTVSLKWIKSRLVLEPFPSEHGANLMRRFESSPGHNAPRDAAGSIGTIT